MKEVTGLGKPETDRCVRSNLDHLAGASHGGLLSRVLARGAYILRHIAFSART
jgi:hypothetical protein